MIHLPPEMIDEVRRAYQNPPRRYHTFEHAEEVLRHVEAVNGELGWTHPLEVRLAALFHDAVYECGASDNEKRSAELAREAIARWLPDAEVDADLVARLIELTAEHGKLTPASVSEEEALFLDCDMAILGQGDAAFDAFDAGVEWEYTQKIPENLYRAGRKKFLSRLAEAERIFLSDYFHEKLDARARDNVTRRLQKP